IPCGYCALRVGSTYNRGLAPPYRRTFPLLNRRTSMLKHSLALAAGVVLSLSAALSQAAETLRVSAIPDEAPTELLRKFEPLGAYLEKELGMPVKFVPVSDYAA